jgi:hypothetical protein
MTSGGPSAGFLVDLPAMAWFENRSDSGSKDALGRFLK